MHFVQRFELRGFLRANSLYSYLGVRENLCKHVSIDQLFAASNSVRP
jgi:hypothetical protein